MVVERLIDDQIALIKITVDYELQEERVQLTSEPTPLTFNSFEPMEDQYDWIEMGIKMTGVKWYNLEVDDLLGFQETLRIDVQIDDTNIICMN